MYLRHAEADAYNARLLLTPAGNPTNDEYILDIAAYHAQQAIEKCLKHVLHDLCGVDDTAREFKTHQLIALIVLTEERTPYAVPQEIKDVAAVVSSWESRTRYGQSPAAAKAQIEDALRRYDSFREDVLAFEQSMRKTV